MKKEWRRIKSHTGQLLSKEDLKNKFRQQRPITKIFVWLGILRIHDDGDGIGIVWSWWNPLTWIIAVLVFFLCPFIGEKFIDVMPFRLSKWWRERKDSLQWL